MNHFSESSREKLLTCHPDLIKLFNHVIIEYDCTIAAGFRNEEDQNKAFKEGNSTKKFPLSMHNKKPSLATDAVPFINGKPSWKREDILRFNGYVHGIADQLFRIGTIKHKIRSGWNWKKPFDPGHFEIIL